MLDIFQTWCILKQRYESFKLSCFDIPVTIKKKYTRFSKNCYNCPQYPLLYDFHNYVTPWSTIIILESLDRRDFGSKNTILWVSISKLQEGGNHPLVCVLVLNDHPKGTR